MNLFVPLFIVVTLFCTPYDDAKSALITLLQSTKSECLVAVYTINSPDLVNTLIALKRQNRRVEVITDSTQASGAHEKLALQQLESAGIPVCVGKSKFHQIMHTKFVVIDNSVSAYGSFNWTDVAQRQDNTLTIDTDPQVADQLHHYWVQIRKDIPATRIHLMPQGRFIHLQPGVWF